MKRRDDFDEREFRVRSRSPEPQEGTLFAEIRTNAPSAPGSSTSAEAAELVSVDGECLRCLTWFARQSGPRTRYELAHAVYPATNGRDTVGVGPACGRVADLVELKYLEEVGKVAGRATLSVTAAGRRWLEKRGVKAA